MLKPTFLCIVFASLISVSMASAASFAVESQGLLVLTDRPDLSPIPPVCRGTDWDGATTVVLTAEDDEFAAGNGNHIILALDGHDKITGGNGKDCIVGGGGNDVIDGGNGDDVLLGGDGDDVISGGNGRDNIDGGPNFDSCSGGNGPNKIINCEGQQTVQGDAGLIVAPRANRSSTPDAHEQAAPFPGSGPARPAPTAVVTAGTTPAAMPTVADPAPAPRREVIPRRESEPGAVMPLMRRDPTPAAVTGP
ncbi:MAG: hypothetical protein ACKVT1_11255 [Dehalococcoidia bacterium]